jgi:hypothetical protein
MKSIGNKSIVLGIIVFFIIGTMPITLSKSNKFIQENEQLTDEIIKYVDIPDAHIYYTQSKIRYPEVEFEEPGAIIDINLSGVPSDEVHIILNLTVHYHTDIPIRNACLVWVISIGEKGEYGGYGTIFSERRLNGYLNSTILFPHGGFPFPTNFSGTIPIFMYLTGLPVWIHRLQRIHNFFDTLRLFGVISSPKIFGAEATYQMDFHT